ncbi:MAG: hypothetical protein ACOYN0_14745, partial [Phycisphaerales bacterium]
MLRNTLLPGAALCLSLGTAFAQDLTPKAPPQRGTVMLYNAAIYPVSKPAIAKGFLVFTDGVIREVGEGDPHVPAPGTVSGYEAVDLNGASVYPGLIA